MNTNKLQIKEFKLKWMADHAAIAMIAKRGTGKSYIIRDIAYHYRRMPGGVVISPTDKLTAYYKFFFPDLYIHYDIKESTIKNILTRQSQIICKSKDKRKQGKKLDPRGILIMDDCLADKKSWAKDVSIREILMNGRHYQLTYILAMQTPLGIPPDLRLNFDYVFLLKDDSNINKKKLYDNYASIFPSLADFIRVFSICTRDFTSMVVDIKKTVDKIEDKIFWFKAKRRKFVFGSRQFRNLHKKYYDPTFKTKEWQSPADNILLARKNKIGLDIKIEKI